MKKIIYLPLALLLIIAAACSSRTNGNQNTAEQTIPAKELFAVIQIKDTVRIGDPAELTFTVYNHTDTVAKFLKWQTPFEPLISKYLDVKNEAGEEMQYKGAMAKRMMPPPADAYITLKPNDSLAVKADISIGYALTKPGKYTVAYTSENVSGLKVADSVTFVYR